ncbi:GNAT family N-acetyltransferase [Sporolactobacillus pectinivorans]|uniref:GNAT family N-acetyltransferase n=1 Tax=Sporolactobacillus pectinivorans TaxID=1591408 RepID=UPI000C25CE4B|nr:GNAT family protein [Sporolactobacillus pectinivorans]
MNIFKENQPDFLFISEQLRLRKFNGIIPQALGWYQDEKMLRFVDGPGRKPYSEETLSRMYAALNDLGELYYIEYKKDNLFQAIGDVTLAIRDLPIVIGDAGLRGKGIGFQVIQTLIERAYDQGLKELHVREIYSYNTASQGLFEKCGFKKDVKTKLGYSYRLVRE